MRRSRRITGRRERSIDVVAPALAALVLALACSGSAGEAQHASRALLELERLSFVPAGPSRLEGFGGPYSDCSLEEALVVDRFEFTRGDWLHYDPEGARASAALFPDWPLASLEGAAEYLPAFLSFAQASEIARARGMRLLSAKEWVHVAAGRRSLVYPYGGLQPQQSWANTLELGYGAPTPVGTFESGKSRRFDCYDLLGNVWEWVSDIVPGYWETHATVSWQPIEGDGLACVMGGGFDSLSRRTFGRYPLQFHAMLLDRSTISCAIGARMAAPADDYLWEMAGRWGRGEEVRARVRTVGKRWSSTSGTELVLPWLQELAARPGAPVALSWLAEGAAEPSAAGSG